MAALVALPVMRSTRDRRLRRDSRRTTVEVVALPVAPAGGWVRRQGCRWRFDGYRRLLRHGGRIGRTIRVLSTDFHVRGKAADRARKRSRRCLRNSALTMVVRSRGRRITRGRWGLTAGRRRREACCAAQRRCREGSRVAVAGRIDVLRIVRAAPISRLGQVRVVRRKGGRSRQGSPRRRRSLSRSWRSRESPSQRAQAEGVGMPWREIADIGAVLVHGGSRRGRRWQTVMG